MSTRRLKPGRSARCPHRPPERKLICGACALAAAPATGPALSPLSASTPLAPATASLCVASDVASADVVAAPADCARECRRERRMCRRYGIVSRQCLNAYIATARCEGRHVDSYAAAPSTGAVQGTGLIRLLDERAHGVKPPEDASQALSDRPADPGHRLEWEAALGAESP